MIGLSSTRLYHTLESHDIRYKLAASILSRPDYLQARDRRFFHEEMDARWERGRSSGIWIIHCQEH